MRKTDIWALTPRRESSLGRGRGVWLEKGRVSGASPEAPCRLNPRPPSFGCARGHAGHGGLVAHPLLADNSPQSVTVSQLRSAGVTPRLPLVQ